MRDRMEYDSSRISFIQFSEMSINNYLDGLARQQDYFSQQKICSLIFCGAEMPLEQQQQIHQQAEKLPGVTVLEFTNDLMSYVNTADAVISMCGYNTITEVLQKSKKAIVIPRIKPGKEQLIRSQAMAKAGLIQMIHPDLLNPDLLIDTLFSSLNKVNKFNSINNLDFAGLPRVADYIAMLLFDSFYINQNSSVALKSA
jgi:predicted glycosyltransferase